MEMADSGGQVWHIGEDGKIGGWFWADRDSAPSVELCRMQCAYRGMTAMLTAIVMDAAENGQHARACATQRVFGKTACDCYLAKAKEVAGAYAKATAREQANQPMGE